ncbi:MAG: response regulator [Nitrospinae bacterium]|nr:response regulator [Nitrospinota bacterium]
MRKRPILVIDDEFHVTRALAFLLEENHFGCIAQNSAENLHEILEKNMPKVVVLDINMPKMDGFEVCQSIRADNKYDDVVIIILSGRSQKEDMDKAFQSGANEYFVKPFSPLALRDKILSIYGEA